MALIFLDQVCLVHIVTISTAETIVLGILFKLGFKFMDLLCSVPIVIINIKEVRSNMSLL